MKNLSTFYPKTILISRTDSLGDVVLTLPLCIWLKHRYPKAKLLFLGKAYTQELIQLVPEIDSILLWSEIELLPLSDQIAYFKNLQIDLAIHVMPNKKVASVLKQAKIPYRIGTFNRWYHWLYCNVLPRFSRKKSLLNEAQLNFELVKPLGLTTIPTLAELSKLCHSIHPPIAELPHQLEQVLQHKKCVILHPKSQGNGIEWQVEHYIELAKLLAAADYQVIFTGRETEAKYFREHIPLDPKIIDSSGQLDLKQLLNLISRVTILVASGTGPLHLAGLFGIHTIGLFPASPIIGAMRWHPLGLHSQVLISKQCNAIDDQTHISGLSDITPQQVFEKINSCNTL